MNTFQNTTVQIINAFTDNNHGGNAAGVVLNAGDLSYEQKLAIAQKVGLSETAFVSKSVIADFKLEFFTPTRQIAHCGHATVATFSYLSQQNRIKGAVSSKETIDGTRKILLQGELAFMEQKAPVYKDVKEQHEKILHSLHLTKENLLPGANILLVNTGNSFVIVPVKSAAILKLIEPDYDLINEISEELDLIGYYVFCTETNIAERDAGTRMFAPRYGIEEESGTGMAAGPLACYLHDILGTKKSRFLIEQGWYMKEPSASLIIVELSLDNENKITQIMTGGKGVVVKQIMI